MIFIPVNSDIRVTGTPPLHPVSVSGRGFDMLCRGTANDIKVNRKELGIVLVAEVESSPVADAVTMT